MSETIRDPTEDRIRSELESRFGDRVRIDKTEPRRVYVTVPREDVFDVCSFIRDALCFEHVSAVTGNDMVDRMEVVYHLSNYNTGIMIEITTVLPADDLRVKSVSSLWEGCNWHERETYELFGIVFEGHPKLERLLTPDTYEFYPFRKSYKLRGQP
ncbi:MAG: NADH-quinone oxidoreductase subunit C [Candidatus Methanoplasma sp.]|jgi:NADH-quinone oxidoreductase subunit C|nr:NADH-quinone oxidoreductase subunit C [Candidatus Methanoplasma sp.]